MLRALRDYCYLLTAMSYSARSYLAWKDVSSKVGLFLVRKKGSSCSVSNLYEASLWGLSPERMNLGMDLRRGGCDSLCFSLRIGY
jgi:hypothetical protein